MAVLTAVEDNFKIIWSVCARDTKNLHRTSPFGVFSAVIEPLALLCIMTLIFSAIRLRIPGVGDWIFLFLMTGIVPIYMFSRGVRTIERFVRRSYSLFWSIIFTPLQFMMGGYLQSLIIMGLLYTIITVVFRLFYRVDMPEQFVLCFIPLICNGAIAFGFAAVNLVIISWFPFWTRIYAIVFGPIAILSGLFYTADKFPQRIQDILYYNPIMHSTELMRMHFFPEFRSSFFDPYYYYGWAIGGVVVGLSIERMFRYRIMVRQKR